MVTIHAESTRHPHRVLQALGKMTNVNDPARGIVCGVALNPGTPLETLDPRLDEVEMILLLAVNPGWGGQKLIASTRERAARLRDKLGEQVLIAVDGGITRDNVTEVARWASDIIVTGSAVFDGPCAEENARTMVGALQ